MGHLDDVKMDYIAHLKNALYYSFESCMSGAIFLVHGFYPDLLVNTGSRKIRQLSKQIEEDSNHEKKN